MMTGTATRLSRFLRREDGVAAIEFAFIAPLLVLFLLGTTQATQSLWANGKIAQTSSVLGDLISQEPELDPSLFDDIMGAATVLIEPLSPDSLGIQVISAIACHQNPNDITNSTPKFFVVWSDSATFDPSVSVSTPASGSELTDPPENLTIQDGNYIIRTSLTYTYQPPISREAGYTLDMEEIAYHQPRNQGSVSYPVREGANSARSNDCDELMNR